MSIGKSPTQYLGVLPQNPPNIIRANRAPTVNDTAFNFGDIWVDGTAGSSYQNYGGGLWISLGSGTTGAVNTLTGTTGGAISPLAGNINILGSAAQGTSVSGALNSLVVTVADWTTSQKGVGILSSDAQAVTGTGTTQAVTPHALTARLAAPGAIGGTTPAAGTFTAVTATTGDIVATLGDLVATNGNLVLVTAGNKIEIATGANASTGVSGVMAGTPGVVTVATTACSATAEVFYSRATAGGTLGHVSITAQDGTGFTLTSTGNETSTFNWWIINA